MKEKEKVDILSFRVLKCMKWREVSGAYMTRK
jgi:hypothetical protein